MPPSFDARITGETTPHEAQVVRAFAAQGQLGVVTLGRVNLAWWFHG